MSSPSMANLYNVKYAYKGFMGYTKKTVQVLSISPQMAANYVSREITDVLEVLAVEKTNAEDIFIDKELLRG